MVEETNKEARATATAAKRGFFTRRRAEIICALLLALMALTMLSVIRQKSITVDEIVMTPAGYYHLTERDFRPVNEHPPFAKVIAAVPLLFTGTEAPKIDPQARPDYGYFLGLFDQFWAMNSERYERVAFWSRVPAVLVTILLGALVFLYARRHWNERAALIAVFLFALEPTVAAHGRVVQTDVPSALALFVFVFTLYGYLRRPGPVRAAFVGAAAGFAAVTKFSMIVLGPVLAVVFFALFVFAPRLKLSRGRVAAHALAVALAAVFAVNAAYLFNQRQPLLLDDAPDNFVVLSRVDESLHEPLAIGYYALQRIFPVDFVSGIGWQLGHARKGHAAGLLGEYSMHGWWYYYPVAFVLKTPIPVLLLSLVSLGWAAWRLLARPRDGEDEDDASGDAKGDRRLLVLVLPVVGFTGLLMLNSINIGVRYLLPVYPFLFILSGVFLDRMLRRYSRRRSLIAGVAVVLLGWTAVEAARAYPDHMSYMNQTASTRPHWWYLSDSNVEWGDDVRPLALYLRERGENRVGGAMLGFQALQHYGIEQTAVFVPPGETPEEVRYVAIGASLLNGSTVPGGFSNGVRLTEEQRVNYFDEYRRRTPEKVFGNSIYLFRMKE